MSDYTDEQYDQLAKILREALSIDSQVEIDVLEMLRRMKYRGYLGDYIVVPDNAMTDAEAKFVPDERRIYIRESTYGAASKREPHARFTIAHEVAHCAHNHQHTRKRGIAVSAFEKKVPTIKRDERQADKLAAAILAPFHRCEFTLATTSEQLAERFGLSDRMASIRVSELAGIYRRRHNIKKDIPAGIIDFLTEQRRRGYVVTSLPANEASAFTPVQNCYTGDACPNRNCGEFKMVRNGTSARCEVCGTATGDG
jgi:Zn-dependent peptidase ImmA (M78 family)